MRINKAIAVGAVTLMAAVSASAASMAPAQAEDLPVTSKGAGYSVKVTASPSLTVRQAPSLFAKSQGSIAKGKTVKVSCKINGTSVGGNKLWYRMSSTKWLSARYASNVGAAPGWCATSYSFEGVVTTASLSVRMGPTNQDKKVGSVARHNDVSIGCKVSSQNVDGNTLWYEVGSGKWVSARYVHNFGATPGWC